MRRRNLWWRLRVKAARRPWWLPWLLWLATLALVLAGVAVFLIFSYATSPSCPPHAVFVGNTVIEFCT